MWNLHESKFQVFENDWPRKKWNTYIISSIFRNFPGSSIVTGLLCCWGACFTWWVLVTALLCCWGTCFTSWVLVTAVLCCWGACFTCRLTDVWSHFPRGRIIKHTSLPREWNLQSGQENWCLHKIATDTGLKRETCIHGQTPHFNVTLIKVLALIETSIFSYMEQINWEWDWKSALSIYSMFWISI